MVSLGVTGCVQHEYGVDRVLRAGGDTRLGRWACVCTSGVSVLAQWWAGVWAGVVAVVSLGVTECVQHESGVDRVLGASGDTRLGRWACVCTSGVSVLAQWWAGVWAGVVAVVSLGVVGCVQHESGVDRVLRAGGDTRLGRWACAAALLPPIRRPQHTEFCTPCLILPAHGSHTLYTPPL